MTRSPPDAGREAQSRRCRWRWGVPTVLLLLATPAFVLATVRTATGSAVHVALLATAGASLQPPSAEPAPRRRIPDREITEPRFAEHAFIPEDGARLPLRKWLPAGHVKAVILALHGFNDYSHAFATPARLWEKRGIATYAFDQRGFGGAPERGGWAGEGRLALDAIEASRILRRTYPGRPLYLLGESMGGGIAVLAMTGAMRGVIPPGAAMPVADADGVILAAPAVWGRATMSLLPKIALFAAARFIPYLRLTGQGLHILASDNLPMLRELARDPMVLKGARVEVIYGLVNLMDDALAAAPKLKQPLLLMYGAHDQIIPRSAIADFAARLPDGGSAGHRLAYYPRGYHLLLRDLDGATVARDVASWILDRNAPLPSGADAGERTRPWPPAARLPAPTALPLAPAFGKG